MLNYLDLSRVKGLPPEYFRRLFKLAAEYFRREPWTICDTHDVIEIQAYGQSRVIQQRSKWADIALCVWDSYDDFWDIFNPAYGTIENAIFSHRPKELSFDPEETIEASHMKYIKKYALPKSGTKFYPTFFGYAANVEVLDLKFIELVLMTFPNFCDKLEPENPYRLKPLVIEDEVQNGLGETVKVKVIYPAGDKPVSDERYDMMLDMVTEVVSIPSYVRTYGQLAEFFRDQCGPTALPSDEYLHKLSTKKLKQQLKNCKVNITGCLDREDLLKAAEKYKNIHLANVGNLKLLGLGNALWKLRTPETTDEAIEMNRKVLEHDAPHDRYGIRFFLLDMYVEMEYWDECRELIEKYKDDKRCTDWLWTKALIEYKDKGGDSSDAQMALFDAVKGNTIVVKYLTSDTAECMDILNAELNFFVTLSGSSEKEKEAKHYFEAYNWYWRRVKGAIEWMREYGTRFKMAVDEGQDSCAVVSINTVPTELPVKPVDDIPLD